jgi:myo-inositol catabolism protein IolC
MKLFILPFDHRSSFFKIAKNKKEIEEAKQIIFNAFLKIYENYSPKKELGILVDEKYGKKIIKQANDKKIITCVPVERSGLEVFQSGYKDLNKIKELSPSYIKVLVRYNPFNIKENKLQLKRLEKVSEFCKENKYKIIFELLVPPTKEDLKLSTDYDKHIRLDRTLQAIQEIQEKVDVHIWKIEGFSKKGLEAITNITNKKIIILGRGENKQKVKTWINNAKEFNQIIGFAIGRTLFQNELEKYLENKISKEKAEKNIANNFLYFINLWNK